VYGYTASNATWTRPVTIAPPASPVVNVANSPAQVPYTQSPYAAPQYPAPQVAAPQYAQAPIVPIVNPYSTPVGVNQVGVGNPGAVGNMYAGSGVPIPPPSGPPTMPMVPGVTAPRLMRKEDMQHLAMDTHRGTDIPKVMAIRKDMVTRRGTVPRKSTGIHKVTDILRGMDTRRDMANRLGPTRWRLIRLVG